MRPKVYWLVVGNSGIIKTLINLNVYISIAAVLLTIETQIELNIGIEWHPYLLLIFFATILEYNLSGCIALIKSSNDLYSPRFKWINENRSVFVFSVLLSIIGFGFTLLFARADVLLMLVAVGILTICYSAPVTKRMESLFKLRQIPYLKIFMIAFVWSVATVLLPFVRAYHSYDVFNVVLIIIERFLFVFAITIPFDIRDMNSDKKAGIKTIPHLIGERKSYILAIAALICFIIVSGIHYSANKKIALSIALFISTLLTIFFIVNKQLRKKNLYYYGIVDGAMIIQGLLVIVGYLLLY